MAASDTHVLRASPSPTDDAWVFTGVPAHLLSPARTRSGKPRAKLVRFTPEQITLRASELSSNRVVHHDEPDKLVVASFEALRFKDEKPSVASEYIFRVLKAGLFLNGRQFRFFGHGNSQLRGRGCYLREANDDKELDERIYAMGEQLKKIMNVAKRAKRIGLLFSGADIDWELSERVGDIEDLTIGDENFSDGCGLISNWLTERLSRKKNIVYRGARYKPCVFQIRYRGYKGVVMLHPALDAAKKHIIEFRKSQKKFTATIDNTFSVVGHSMPYTFGRLNNEIVVLLSSLGITTDTFERKQKEYFEWIRAAATDPIQGFEFLSALGKHRAAERLFLYGFDKSAAPDEEDARLAGVDVRKEVLGAQLSELAAFRKNGDERRERVRMLVRKSRRLYGVCDPFRILKEGEVHVRITASRAGATTLHGTDVIIVRNPCLHPGDILKLRAVYKPELAHLVDCVCFASVGKRADPSKSSGGDLDGDEYFVCWDPNLVPRTVLEPYTYPPNKENTQVKITREDLARYFAFYNNSSMARTTALHNKWARYSPQGALSKECQELNALYSQAVDGARVTIPDRLRSPPEPPEGSVFVLTVLADAAREFAQTLLIEGAAAESAPLSADDADALIQQLFAAREPLLSELHLVNLAHRLARRHSLDFRRYFAHINWGALGDAEKRALFAALDMQPAEAYAWNSLLRSDIVTAADLSPKRLGGPLRVQRLFSSRELGRHAFFEYLVRAMQNYTRRLVIVKLDQRFAFAFFLRGDIALNEDAPVDGEHITVASFMKLSAMEALPTFKYFPEGFRLYCGEGNVQLFNKTRANTFIHLRKPPQNSNEDFIVSIALQQISARVQKQMGRVNRTPIVDMEIHVVSNRDRVAQQLFDLRADHVDTEEYIRRLSHIPTTYQLNTLDTADLETFPEHLREVFSGVEARVKAYLGSIDADAGLGDFDRILEFAWTHRCETQLFWAFDALIEHVPLSVHLVGKWIDRQPLLVYCLLKRYPPNEDGRLHDVIAREKLGPALVEQVIRSTPVVPVAALVALEKLTATIAAIEFKEYMKLVELAVLAIRAPEQVVETLFVLHEQRAAARAESPTAEYAHNQALRTAVDRAQEANDECPCDEQGRPRRQRSAPAVVPLRPQKDDLMVVVAEPRVDAPLTVRLHSHVRLRAASTPEKGDAEAPIMDGVVTVMQAGEVRISLVHTPPPEYASMEWFMYDAGSIATFRAMMEAIRRLATSGADCCTFYRSIAETSTVASDVSESNAQFQQTSEAEETDDLNASQFHARARSVTSQLSLVWGPPGTGKTTVVVRILESFVRSLSEGRRILMTASTNNAVDNVLERFIKLNDRENLISADRIVRFATDRSRVSKALHSYTLEGRVGGEIVRDRRRSERAEELLENAAIVFTTCTSAGLGGLRTQNEFDTVLIDEASQITEPVALIPLVKGCQRAVLVGDHVQLRPMVRQMGPAMLFDVSLFERLYTGPELPGMTRTMLDIQYRFPKELAHFPSNEFYEGRLRSAMSDTEAVELSLPLRSLQFPWSTDERGRIQPAVFVHCDKEEEYGGSSKSNEGQAELVAHIVKLLSTWSISEEEERPSLPSVAVLTPYTKQAKALRNRVHVPVSTIDAFQGREADIVVFSTVRSNPDNDIGFVEDMRRLNVAWTRARRALIVVGDRRTMTEGSELWKRAIASCNSIEVVPET